MVEMKNMIGDNLKKSIEFLYSRIAEVEQKLWSFKKEEIAECGK